MEHIRIIYETVDFQQANLGRVPRQPDFGCLHFGTTAG